MKVMKLRNIVMLLAILPLFSAPSWAGSFSLFGSYWDSKDADASWGAGARVGFNLTKMLELEFHGTYYPDFKNDQFSGQSFELTAIPVDGGLKLNFMPDKGLNPFVGGGATYYFLSISPGSVDDQTGVYLDAGIDIGGKDSARFFAEVMWRKVDTSVSFGAFDEDVKFDGLALNAGATWRWGK
jgi:Outer membrane protein beta-barrel domain